MEPICNAPGTVKGIEVLFFEDAELTKTKGNEKCFATFGPLSVLYFPTYNRFVLQLNDWRYPVLRRNPIVSPEDGSYTLPAKNNFFYNLTIKGKPGQSVANLEAIFNATRKLEVSPDDKLVRLPATKTEITTKDVISQTIKQAVHKVQIKAATFKTGTKGLTSTKKMVNLKDIKNKDFKKDAHSRIKKNFFQSNEKLSNEFLQKRRNNANLSEAREFDALRKTSDAAIMYLPKEDVEAAILKAKDVSQGLKERAVEAEKPKDRGLMASLRAGIQGVKDTLRGSDSRNMPVAEVPTNTLPVSTEGMTHYQG